MLWSALGHRLGVAPGAWANGLSLVLAAVLAAVLVRAAFVRLGARDWALAGAALLVVCASPLAVWSTSGMGVMTDGLGVGSWNIAVMVWSASSRAKSRRPVSSSHNTTPNENWSARPSTSLPRACSGAM